MAGKGGEPETCIRRGAGEETYLIGLGDGLEEVVERVLLYLSPYGFLEVGLGGVVVVKTCKIGNIVREDVRASVDAVGDACGLEMVDTPGNAATNGSDDI